MQLIDRKRNITFVSESVAYCPFASNLTPERLNLYALGKGIRNAEKQDRGLHFIDDMQMVFLIETPLWSRSVADDFPTGGATIIPAKGRRVISRAYEYSATEFLKIAAQESGVSMHRLPKLNIQQVLDAGAEGLPVLDGLYGRIQYAGPVNVGTQEAPRLVPGLTFRMIFKETEIAASRRDVTLKNCREATYRYHNIPLVGFGSAPNKAYGAAIRAGLEELVGVDLKGFDRRWMDTRGVEHLPPIGQYMLGSKQTQHVLQNERGLNLFDYFKSTEMPLDEALSHKVPDGIPVHPAAYMLRVIEEAAKITGPVARETDNLGIRASRALEAAHLTVRTKPEMAVPALS